MTPVSRTTLLAHGLLQDPGAVPLVIGVVGHRDPVDAILPTLQRHLAQQLEQLLRELPHTPLVMLNGLAEGIDTMAAQVFLQVVAADRKRRGAEAPAHLLVAALPKPPDLYRHDFDTHDALKALEDTLTRCDAVLHPGNCPDLRIPASPDGQPRAADDPACYGQQGLFMVHNTYLMIAFYDGVDTFLTGGTSQTVAMHQGLIHPTFVSVDEVLNKQESGVLVVHHTPRRKPGSPQENAARISFWPDCGATGVLIPEPLLAIPRYLEDINAAISAPGFKPASYGEGTNTRLWTLADQRANTNKKRYELLCRILVGLGFVLVVLAQLQEPLKALWWGALLVAFLVFPKLQERPKQEFISQRCLAECLTVQHLWAATGLEHSAADLFLSRSHGELGWIRTVVRSVRIQLLSLYAREPRQEDLSLQRARQWIDGQAAYLSSKIRVLSGKAERWRRLAILFAVLAVAVAVMSVMPGWQVLDPWVEVLLAGFASVIGYRELMGYQDTKERYALSLEQFSRAQSALAAINPAIQVPSARAYEREKIVVEAIGREKLDELNHWVSDQLQRVYAPGT